MKRLALICLLIAACDKPTEESCRKAIENMRKVMGTSSYTEDIEPFVRKCRNGSSKTAVECASNAKSREDLLKCEFVHFDDKVTPAGSGSGSGTGSGS